MEQLRSIQALRGFAAVAVVLYHCYFFKEGYLGVDLFFCLSGFIISSIHFNDIGNPGKARVFALKRFIRVYPLLFVLVAAWTIMHFVKGMVGLGWTSHELHGEPFWSGIVPTLFMIPTFPPMQRALPVSWTLPYETIFYLFFWLIIVGGKRLSLILTVGWVALILTFNLYLAMPHMDWQVPSHWALLNCFILEFFLGVAVARISTLTPLVWLFISLAMLGVGGIFGLFINGGPSSTLPPPFGTAFLLSKLYTGLAFSLMMIGCVGIERRSHYQFPRFFQTIGDASYSIYLVHYFAIDSGNFVANSLRLSKTITHLVFVLVSIASGILLHFWVEKPMLLWLRSRYVHRPFTAAHS